MLLQRLSLPADARFWPQAARAVIEFASSHGQPERQLQALTWLVPAGVHAALARAALHRQFGRSPLQVVTVGVSTFRPPAGSPRGKATLRKLSVSPAASR